MGVAQTPAERWWPIDLAVTSARRHGFHAANNLF